MNRRFKSMLIFSALSLAACSGGGKGEAPRIEEEVAVRANGSSHLCAWSNTNYKCEFKVTEGPMAGESQAMTISLKRNSKDTRFVQFLRHSIKADGNVHTATESHGQVQFSVLCSSKSVRLDFMSTQTKEGVKIELQNLGNPQVQLSMYAQSESGVGRRAFGTCSASR